MEYMFVEWIPFVIHLSSQRVVCKGVNPNSTVPLEREALGLAIISAVGGCKYSFFFLLHFLFNEVAPGKYIA